MAKKIITKEIFTNCIILDGTKDMVPAGGKAIVCEDGFIKEIIDEAKVKDAGYAEFEIIDLEGKYIMPGLINMHVHLALSGAAPKPKAEKKQVNYEALYKLVSNIAPVRMVFQKIVAGYAKTHLLSGSTTIRTVGGILDFDSVTRDKINKGSLVGPRILCANTAVSVPGGHFAGSLGTQATCPEDAVRDVDEIAKTKPDLIKLMITGGVMDCKVLGEPGELKMSPEIVKAACDEAHKLGYIVSAHVESSEGLKVALENGVDSIEHGSTPSDETLALFKEKKAFFINTFSPAIPYALFDRSVSHCTKEANINGKALFDHEIACAKACLENDIPVGLGTDASCPFTTHYNFWRELYYFSKYCGVSNSFALHTATLVNAKLAGVDSITGSVETGKSADLIVTKGNPLDDLTVLKNIDMVVFKGKVINSPKVKKMADVDEALDQYM